VSDSGLLYGALVFHARALNDSKVQVVFSRCLVGRVISLGVFCLSRVIRINLLNVEINYSLV